MRGRNRFIQEENPAGFARDCFSPRLCFFEGVNVTVRQKLSEARWRLVRNDFCDGAVWALLAGLSGLVLLRALGRGAMPGPAILAVFLVLPLLVVLGGACVRWRSSSKVARELDVRAGTKDRFLVSLLGCGSGVWGEITQREVASYAARMRLDAVLRWQGSWRRWIWLLVPVLLWAGLEGVSLKRDAARADELAEARRMVEEARIAAAREPELAVTAEELDQTLKSLPESAEPVRDALRALAELERKLSQSSGEDALSAAEASALAAALAGEAPQLAGALQAGDRQAAAAGVAGLDPAALARALEQAAKHVESRRLQELARDGQAQEKLGGLLKSAPAGGGGEARKKFLSALRDIKQGGQGESKEGENARGQGQPGEDPQGGEKPQSGLADNTPPGGAPGSEKDLGQGADLGSEKDPLREAAGPEEFVAGQMADGASLVEMLRAAGGDDPAARRAWKAVYQTAAPAALDAVAQEEIAPGSRLLVKKYFEAIRPNE